MASIERKINGTSSWPVYQFQHSRKCSSPKKDCLIIIASRDPNVNCFSPISRKNFHGPGIRPGPPKTVPAA